MTTNRIKMPRPVSGGVMLSYKCSAACRHCMYACSPQWKADWITVEALYRLLSHTRFRGQVLLQLNYILWFPARPPEKPGDIYAGRFDGINFRVTLSGEGRPLLFDSIHNCGCYHKFFPVAP